MTRHYDVVVIGSGPGGEGAAMTLAKAGRQVAMIERHNMVGGGCTHWGTIPSKALRQTIQRITDFREDPLFQTIADSLEITYPQLLRNAEAVITSQVRMRRRFYERNKVKIYHGEARFSDPHSLSVTSPNGGHKVLSADHVVIATGSRPYRPDDIDFSHPRIVDSDTVLGLRETPRSIAIYGAGVIGCEYASIFSNLNISVHLINTRETLLSHLDQEITDSLSYHMIDQGIMLFHGEEYAAVAGDDDGVVLQLQSGKKIRSDILMWANGRTGNSQALALEGIGIDVDHRGHIAVNEHYQTAQPHIYAVGDVVGPPALASASYDQGRFCGRHIIDSRSDLSLVRDIPTGIYTSPEISYVGRTERELTEQQVPYEVGRAIFKNLARAQITGWTTGMLKILFHRDTLQILGIHCFGHQSSEIIHIGQAIMAQEGEANTLRYFADTTFNYPTMAEAYRVAALNGLNRVF
jgi:NAD(P) transhydrogenase